MTAWRYEISLLVLKNISLVRYFSTLEEKFRISARPCNILYLFWGSQLGLGKSFVVGKTFIKELISAAQSLSLSGYVVSKKT